MRALLLPIVVVAAALASARTQEQAAAGDARFRGAARDFLAALRPQSRAQASFAFDDAQRLDWHFIPRDRKGLPLGAMNDDERRAAHALLRSFLTPRGYGRALGVIELEGVLREIENNPGRDQGRYFFSVFGDLAGDAPWSLRFEGHHLALNFTGVGAAGIAPTPFFLGSNPAEVKSGPRAGFKLLAPHEELARALVKSLTAEQRKKAVVSETAPADVLFGPGTVADATSEQGLPLSELTSEQIDLAVELISELQDDVATLETRRMIHHSILGRVREPSATRFAWAGGVEPGQGHYWRLAGPEAILEYDNTQGGANHVHFLWRDPKNDFAADWLARHHRDEH